MIFILIIIILLILAEIFALLTVCRRGHSLWKLLRQYRYAHRGYHGKDLAPENSLLAFKEAIRRGFGCELDVHLMKDGRLAVIHDASLLRTAGAEVQVEDLTAEELKSYRLEGTEERIPLLEEVLPLFEESGLPLVVELKAERGDHDTLAAATCALLDQYKVLYCIESFDPRCLMWLRKYRPEICRGQLSQSFMRHGDGGRHSKLTLFILDHLLMNFLTCPDFIAYRFCDRHNANLRWCRKVFGVQEVNWTITTKEEMEDAERDGNLVIFERFDPRA